MEFCFLNTCVTTSHNNLGPYVSWKHLISAKLLENLAMTVSVHPTVRSIGNGLHRSKESSKSTRYIGVLYTFNVRLTPNFVFKLLYYFLM